jgi:rhamnose transport system permease protein
VNALLIARLGLPPLIVTLGTFSLFRGLAEGATEAAVSYTGFGSRFLALGQGYLWGVVPAQLPVLVLALAAYHVLLHRSVLGRALFAIGFSADGARYAGSPVARRVGLVYMLSGLLASIAAIVYIAHLGQARSDAGTGYELDAITAVVLGGTSVFGGRGSLGGTALGLAALSVLKNGLQLAALPSELIGVITGVLLVTTIAIDRLSQRERLAARTDSVVLDEVPVKNSQVAVLCGAVLVGSSSWRHQRGWCDRLSRASARPVKRSVRFAGRRLTPGARSSP